MTNDAETGVETGTTTKTRRIARSVHCTRSATKRSFDVKFVVIAASLGVLASFASLGFSAQAAVTGLSNQDRTFATKAAQGGVAEVADARLALKTSRTPKVDVFAKQMVRDHSAANAKLLAILKGEGIAAPASVGPANLAIHAKLASLHGVAFDRAYLAAQKAAHEQTIALFKHEVTSGKDAQLVEFAETTLPMIESHLAMLTKP